MENHSEFVGRHLDSAYGRVHRLQECLQVSSPLLPLRGRQPDRGGYFENLLHIGELRRRLFKVSRRRDRCRTGKGGKAAAAAARAALLIRSCPAFISLATLCCIVKAGAFEKVIETCRAFPVTPSTFPPAFSADCRTIGSG
jgi:hypothetical protein